MMIFSNFLKRKFGIISTVSLAVLSALLLSPDVRAMDVSDMDEAQVQPLKAKANEGDMKAQYTLGEIYREQANVKPWNRKRSEYCNNKAMRFYKMAADQDCVDKDCADAQYQVSVLYTSLDLDSLGFLKRKENSDYCKKAADQGHMQAQYRLGQMYRLGYGVREDKSKAFEYYRLSADQGNAEAQFQAGFCYESGRGVGESKEIAISYYQLAAQQGHEAALNAAQDVREKLQRSM